MSVVLLTDAWELNPAVSARLEAFGAVTYDGSGGQLTFLKAADLDAVVGHLATAPDVQTALVRAEVPLSEWGVHVRSLQRMAETGMLRRRS